MRTIDDLLNIAKKNVGTKSDRELSRRLGLTSVNHYRKRNVIPDDFTAMKLAELCELPAHEVLITCHMLKAEMGEHPETHGLWKDVLKMVSNGCIVLVAVLFMTLSPSKAAASSGVQVFTPDTSIISIMRRCFLLFVGILIALSNLQN